MSAGPVHPVTGKEWLPSYNSIVSARATVALIYSNVQRLNADERRFLVAMEVRLRRPGKRLTKNQARRLEEMYREYAAHPCEKRGQER